MTWSLVQQNGGSTASSSSARTVTYTSAVNAGDLLVVAACTRVTSGSAPTPAISDTQGNTWSLVTGSALSFDAGVCTLCVWWCVAQSSSGAGVNVVTLTPGVTCTMGVGVLEYSSSLSSLAVDGTSTASGSSTAPAPGSVAVSGSDDLSLAFVGWTAGAARTLTASSPYTLRVDQNTSGTLTAGVGSSDAFDVAAAQSPSFALSTSSQWGALGVTFTGTAAGGAARVPWHLFFQGVLGQGVA